MSDGTFIASAVLAIASAVLLVASTSLSDIRHRFSSAIILTVALVAGVWLVKDHEAAASEWYQRYNIGNMIDDQVALIRAGEEAKLLHILEANSDRAPEWEALGALRIELSEATRALIDKTEQGGAGQAATEGDSAPE